MCGRFLLDTDFKRIIDYYGYLEYMEPDYDFSEEEIRPGTEILTLSSEGFTTMKWGMDYDFLSKTLINARSETAETKRLFSEAYRKRRVIIPATAYFEWKGKDKYVFRSDEDILSLAGIYNVVNTDKGPVKEVVILTTDPGERLGAIHNRMPLIINREMADKWLDPKASSIEEFGYKIDRINYSKVEADSIENELRLFD